MTYTRYQIARLLVNFALLALPEKPTKYVRTTLERAGGALVEECNIRKHKVRLD